MTKVAALLLAAPLRRIRGVAGVQDPGGSASGYSVVRSTHSFRLRSRSEDA
jgi:hypothetical protein